MAAATTAQFLVSEVIGFKKVRPENHRQIAPYAVTEVSAQQTARGKREWWLGLSCIRPYVKQF